MFAYLEMTDRMDFNPIEFCHAFKDFAGMPVDVSVQQDTQEFLNMIFDKLENALRPTPFKFILDGVYGGKTCTELTCSQCSNIKCREETFYNLSVPIKNLKTLHECLEKFIQGEVISDYKCDACNKKADVMKRQFISGLPNVLIVHLQRIVFNLDILQNEKINSRVEFPHELNLAPYMGDQGEQSDAHYKLTGVVVHIGAADYGHYFSYIEESG
jgi:ubiquitin carboxyl-terminal hydrolase 34